MVKRRPFGMIRCEHKLISRDLFIHLRARAIFATLLIMLFSSILGSCPKSGPVSKKPDQHQPNVPDYLFLGVYGGRLTLFENGEPSLCKLLATYLHSVTDFSYDEKRSSLFVTDGHALAIAEHGMDKPILLEVAGEIGKHFLTSLAVSPSRQNAILVGFDPIKPQGDNLVYWVDAGNGKCNRITLPEMPTSLFLVDSKFIGEQSALLLYQANENGKGFVFQITAGKNAKKLLEIGGQVEHPGASEVEPVKVEQEEPIIKLNSILTAGDTLLLAVSITESLDELPRSELWKFSLEKSAILDKFELPPLTEEPFVDMGFATLGDEVYYARLSGEPSDVVKQEVKESGLDVEENQAHTQLKLGVFRFNLKTRKPEEITEVEPSRFSECPLYSVQLFPKSGILVLSYEDGKVYQAVPLSFSGVQVCPAFRVDKPKVQLIQEKPWFIEKPSRQK